MSGERGNEVTNPWDWPCDNYRFPATCLTAPSSETGRCDHCQAEAARAHGETP